MNKKAFTLIEIVVSITIFSIVLVFLYESLDISKKFNATYSKHLENYLSKSYLENLIFEDIFETTESINIEADKDSNSILKLYSNNTFHNPFSTNITYFLTKNNKLIRVESKTEFDKNNIDSNFLDDDYTFIDIVAKDIKSFIVLPHKLDRNSLTIHITTMQNKNYLFSAKAFIP